MVSGEGFINKKKKQKMPSFSTASLSRRKKALEGLRARRREGRRRPRGRFWKIDGLFGFLSVLD